MCKKDSNNGKEDGKDWIFMLCTVVDVTGASSQFKRLKVDMLNPFWVYPSVWCKKVV